MNPRDLSLKSSVSRVGAAAREQLIEAAGEIFAAKGFDGATGREICLRAGVNAAAVNYHFGGFDALYAQTLIEAHRRAIWTDAFAEITLADLPAKQKLVGILGVMVRRMVEPISKSWEMRLLSRELVSPTIATEQFVEMAIEPQRRLMKIIIAETMACEPDDPCVGRTLLSVIAPCIFLAISNQRMLETMLPTLSDPISEIDALVAHLQRFLVAGLDDVARRRSEALTPSGRE